MACGGGMGGGGGGVLERARVEWIHISLPRTSGRWYSGLTFRRSSSSALARVPRLFRLVTVLKRRSELCSSLTAHDALLLASWLALDASASHASGAALLALPASSPKSIALLQCSATPAIAAASGEPSRHAMPTPSLCSRRAEPRVPEPPEPPMSTGAVHQGAVVEQKAARSACVMSGKKRPSSDGGGGGGVAQSERVVLALQLRSHHVTRNE